MMDVRPDVTMETWGGTVRDLVIKDEWRALHLFIDIRAAARARGMERLSESIRDWF